MKIYLAGFDVFKDNAVSVFAALSAEAAKHELTAISPLDGELPPEIISAELAHHIFTSNIAKLSEVDGVIANLAPFRGHEPDSGTVFEVGYAIARGIPVIGYGVPGGTYAERLAATLPCSRCEKGILREQDSGWLVEDFGLPLNLMLSCSVELRATSAEALRDLAKLLQRRRKDAQPGLNVKPQH